MKFHLELRPSNVEAAQSLLLNFCRKFEVDWTPKRFMRVATDSRGLMAHHREHANFAPCQFIPD